MRPATRKGSGVRANACEGHLLRAPERTFPPRLVRAADRT
jgi:hypothetical protein